MNKNTITTVALGTFLFLGGIFYFYSKSFQTNTVPSSPESSSTPVTTNLAAKPIISDVLMSTALTSSGAAMNPVKIFNSKTPKIFAVLSLKNATAKTQLSYIRYYGGKYVDSKVSHPSMDNISYFHFEWDLKAGQILKKGNYTLVFFVDGKKANAVNYIIQ